MGTSRSKGPKPTVTPKMHSTQTNLIQDQSRPWIKTAALPLRAHRRGSVKLATVDKVALRNPLVLGTWNVQSLSQSGKVELLATELDNLRWNVMGISEMRWTGTGESTTDEGHKVWYCGLEKKRQHGVGFIVEKQTANRVPEGTPVSERVISIRIASKP